MTSKLTVSVTQDRTLLPEWIESKGKISEQSAEIQKEIFKTYTRDAGSWLFYLGFIKQNTELSSSINYYIQFSALFIQNLSRMPNLETLRHTVQVEIAEDALTQFVESAPMMTGAEYIDVNMLTDLWK
jgi:hypothetical protein